MYAPSLLFHLRFICVSDVSTQPGATFFLAAHLICPRLYVKQTEEINKSGNQGGHNNGPYFATHIHS